MNLLLALNPMNKYFKLAKQIALSDVQKKHYLLGAVGVRSDGCIVKSSNIRNMHMDVSCHAEARLTKKLDVGSIVYVVHVQRSTGNLLNARPCKGCQFKMRNKGVRRCYYTINEHEVGIINFE